jgi:hypothetical protein
MVTASPAMTVIAARTVTPAATGLVGAGQARVFRIFPVSLTILLSFRRNDSGITVAGEVILSAVFHAG